MQHSRAASAKDAPSAALHHGICMLALAGMVFSASGAGYFPFVNLDTVNALRRDVGVNPTAILGTIATLLNFALCAFVFARGAARLSLSGAFASLFCVYAGITLLWSGMNFPALLGILKGIAFLVSADHCIKILGVRKASLVLMAAILAICLWSLALAGLDPRFRVVSVNSTAYNSELYGWRGSFSHKNHLSGFCLMSIILLLALARFLPNRGWLWLTIGVASFLLIESRGKSGQLIVLILAAYSAAYYSFRRVVALSPSLSFLSAVTLLLIAAACFTTSPWGQNFDWTFTGRSEIWSAYLRLGMSEPFFGHGAGDSLTSDAIFGYIRQYASGMTSAHNSYLAVFFAEGLVGVTLLFAWLITATLEASRARSPEQIKFFVLASIVAAALYGMFEAKVSPHIGASYPALVVTLGLMIQHQISLAGGTVPAGQRPKKRAAVKATRRQFANG